MTLCVFYQCRRMIKTHWLIVEQRASKRRQVIRAQIGARVGEQGEARRMRLREPEHGEGCDRFYDLVLRLPGNVIVFHSGSQLAFDLLHTLFGALEAERTA